MTHDAADTNGHRTSTTVPRLTQMSSCAGCAAKLSQTLLAQVLEQMPNSRRLRDDPNVLIGAHTFDDAGVYRLRPDLALVQTVDFFTPIVDDPYDFGQIAATNAISDVFAMGGRPITALNLVGIPADKLGPQTIADILRGGLDKAADAGCAIIGGHTIRLPEPVYGMSVTGLVHPDRILSNDRAEPGDLLVLTKPLGTGITTTAIKRGIASDECARRAIDSMKVLNTPGADIAERGLARCATDITGFGLLGHLGNIVRASGVGAEVIAADVPPLSPEIFSLIDQECIPGGTRSNLAAAESITDWGATSGRVRVLLSDAQTSGGLLLCIAPRDLQGTLQLLRSRDTPAAAVIGRITASSTPRIVVRS
jgi:selenide,water dikinase